MSGKQIFVASHLKITKKIIIKMIDLIWDRSRSNQRSEIAMYMCVQPN